MWTVIGRLLFCLLCVGVFLYSDMAVAEDVSFEATVNANQISLQEAVELTLTIHGLKGSVPAIPMPVIDGFDLRYVGPSDKFTFINGVSSNEHSFVYNLFPSKTGHFQIPSVLVKLDGKDYRSNPIDITVIDKPTAVTSNLNDIENKTQETLQDKVFLKATIDHPMVYVGEKTPLRMKVFVKDVSLQLAAAPSLKPNGFTTDATCNMQKGREVVNGVSYETLTFDTNIYPTKAGTITVGPFDAQGQLVYRVKQTTDNMLADFFGIQETKPITLTAEAISIQAVDLPKEGVPSGFSGAVGQYEFKASISPTSIKFGDPLTLRMTLSGQGRFKDVVLPLLPDPPFKRYDPQIKETEDSKTIEQVIVPIDPDMKQISAVTFSYFDPKDEKYKTITQGPFPISITPVAKTEEFKAYGFVDKTPQDKTMKLDGINTFGRGLIHQTRTIMTNWIFWFVVVIVGVNWIGWIFWQRFQKKLNNDAAFARRLKAYSLAKEGIKQGQEALQQQKIQEFYSAVFKTLQNYLADKLDKPVGSFTLETIKSQLMARGIEQQYLEVLKELFERCDHVRFAAGSIDQSTMQKDFQKLQESIVYLDKKLK